ncbi:RNA polymerase sigma factor [Actinomadura hibisca]|uniref:RNA polymerase sigma factor n=1 Tax=Actinomadura hibisca TaxID=68565 RepID=UPI00082DD613|nr:RNA polymerase sigma factor [Actinomadura hibisca]
MTAPSEIDEASDAEVLARSVHEPEWFATVFDRHIDAIHRYAARRLGAEIAQDVVAETFLTAFRKRAGYDPRRPDARPWLYAIVTNAIRAHKRAEVRRNRALARAGGRAEGEPFTERSDARLTAQRLQPALAAALAKLSAADRDLLLLIAWADFSYEEAADALGIPVGTVRSRLHRIRKKTSRFLGGDPLSTGEEQA